MPLIAASGDAAFAWSHPAVVAGIAASMSLLIWFLRWLVNRGEKAADTLQAKVKTNQELWDELQRLQADFTQLQLENVTMKAQIATLSSELEAAENTISELRDELRRERQQRISGDREEL